jgi:hypothetical protein
MTRAQAQEIAAALMDIKGWLRELGDALLMTAILLVSIVALAAALRAPLGMGAM